MIELICEPGWTKVGELCYHPIVEPAAISWQEAEKKARQMGGVLTSIHNAQHNEFLLGLMPPLDERLEFGQRRIGENNNGFWIGLKLLGKRGNDGNTVFNYTWADSTPFDFGALPERDDEESVWIPSVNTKNIFDSVEQCVFLTSDGWNPTDCSGLFSSRVPGFIVTKPPVAKNASNNSSNSGRLECH